MMMSGWTVLNLGRAARGDATRGERARTEEFDVGEGEDGDPRPQAIQQPMQTAQIDVGRDRPRTPTSPIPAIIADSIVRERSITPRRDPAAPRLEAVEETRRVGDSDPVRSGSGPTLKSDVGGTAPWRQRAAQRIDEARAALDAGDSAAPFRARGSSRR